MNPGRVPKLNLGTPSDEDVGPVYTTKSQPGISSRSNGSFSTVSWGTDSSPRAFLEKSRGDFCSEPVVSPPWATHLPTIQKSPKATAPDNPTPKEEYKVSSSRRPSASGKETDRICSQLEQYWKNQPVNGDGDERYKVVDSMAVTPRQVINASLRQQPGLVRPALISHRGLIGSEVHSKFKHQIWFNARLSVFEATDFRTVPHRRHECSSSEWRNSVSAWALRSFTGVAFPDDSTWTLYEDHKAGMRSVYCCGWGERFGQPYLPEVDFFPGALLFITYPQPQCAPEPLRRFLKHTGGVLRIRIVSVDTKAKRKALEAELTRQGVPQELWCSLMAKLHVARLPHKPGLQCRLLKLQASWRRVLRGRSSPVETYIQLYAYYRDQLARKLNNITDEDDTPEVVCRRVLEDGLRRFRLPLLSDDCLDLLWDACKSESGYDGLIHYADYMHVAFGELPDNQRQTVIKAFLKTDPNRLGHVKLLDMGRFYSAPRLASKYSGAYIPSLRSEVMPVFERFVACAEHIDFAEFTAFYEGVSIALGESMLDTVTDESGMEILAPMFLLNKLNSDSPDSTGTFQKILETSWRI